MNTPKEPAATPEEVGCIWCSEPGTDLPRECAGCGRMLYALLTPDTTLLHLCASLLRDLPQGVVALHVLHDRNDQGQPVLGFRVTVYDHDDQGHNPTKVAETAGKWKATPCCPACGGDAWVRSDGRGLATSWPRDMQQLVACQGCGGRAPFTAWVWWLVSPRRPEPGEATTHPGEARAVIEGATNPVDYPAVQGALAWKQERLDEAGLAMESARNLIHQARLARYAQGEELRRADQADNLVAQAMRVLGDAIANLDRPWEEDLC